MKQFLPIYIFITLLVCIATGCEMETDWNIDNKGSFLVVDCIITNELKQHELMLTRSVRELNDTPQGITGALIRLKTGSEEILFTDDGAKPGRYISTVPFMATAGITYCLSVASGGINDSAYATMTGITPLDSVQIVTYNELFRVNYAESPQPSMMQIYYNWSADSIYTGIYGAAEASEVFYSLDNIDAGKLFPPEKEIIAFPKNTTIIRRKYSLSEEHQQFLRSLLLETEWRGGMFDVEQGNVMTNFKNGVRGWFAACMVLTDTTEFK